MRLRRLVLTDYRGVSSRTVEFAPTGVTVVVGDNETGKSSLLEAFELLRTLPDDSRATRLRAVQPAGHDVATEVEAELTLGDETVHYRKRWFKQRLTELRLSSPDDGVRTFTGREAHDEALRLFGERVDKTLWAALVAGQADSLDVPAPGSVAAVLTALDAASAQERDDDEAHHGESVSVTEAVEQEYLRYFTSTGRPTGAHAEALRALDEARTTVDQAAASCAQVEKDVERAERLGQDRATYATRLAEQAQAVADLEERRRTAGELLAKVERLRQEHELAVERLAAARGELERRTALVAELARREQGLDEATRAAELARAALRAAEAGLQRSMASGEAVRDDHANARAEAARLESRLARLRDEADLAEASRRLAAVEEAQAAEAAAVVTLERNRVDAEQAEAAEAAHRRVLAARAALDAGAPRLLVRRLGDAVVEVDAMPRTEEEFEVVAERATELEVAGVLALTVQPGEGAGELAATLEAAERAEADLLADLDLPDIAAVRSAARARLEAERRLESARETLARRTEGATVSEIRQRRDLLAARLADQAVLPGAAGGGSEGAAGGGDAGSGADDAGEARVTDPAALDAAREALASAREAEAGAASRLADAELVETLARKEYESASTAMTEARVRAEHDAERRDDLVATLAAARQGQPDDALAEAVQEAERQADHLAAGLESARSAVAEAGAEEIARRLADAVAVREQMAAEIESLVDELRRIEGRLEQAGAQGLATALDRARADLANVERRAEILQRRAAAAALLRETLSRHRAEARRRYAAPLRERIEALGRVVHGPSFQVVLGEDLDVTVREVDGIALPVGSLSTGAREQLATVVRLAIASLTAADGTGVPVILDDALGWSDPGRLRAMGALLDRVAAAGQVIVLTCVPDRYAHVPHAHKIRL